MTNPISTNLREASLNIEAASKCLEQSHELPTLLPMLDTRTLAAKSKVFDEAAAMAEQVQVHSKRARDSEAVRESKEKENGDLKKRIAELEKDYNQRIRVLQRELWRLQLEVEIKDGDLGMTTMATTDTKFIDKVLEYAIQIHAKEGNPPDNAAAFIRKHIILRTPEARRVFEDLHKTAVKFGDNETEILWAMAYNHH